jgi:hypothetical protein
MREDDEKKVAKRRVSMFVDCGTLFCKYKILFCAREEKKNMKERTCTGALYQHNQ